MILIISFIFSKLHQVTDMQTYLRLFIIKKLKNISI